MNNWAELGKPFQNFNQEVTNTWIENGFTVEAAKEWLEIDKYYQINYQSSYLISWLRDEKKVTINYWKKLIYYLKKDLNNQFKQYCKEKNLVSCNWCWKEVEENSIFFIIGLENNLDFCSENCQFKWNNLLIAQNYLEHWYPKNGTCIRESEYSQNNNFSKKRSEITKLNLSKQQLKGSLDLFGFISLEKLNCSDNQLISLEINNCYKLKELNVADNQLTSLNVNNCLNLISLNVSKNNLISLEINNCLNLRHLRASNNKLTEIILPIGGNLIFLNFSDNNLTRLNLFTNNQLKEVYISNNQLINFPYQSLNSLTLTNLVIDNNNFQTTDIEVFSHLFNLEELLIGNYYYHIENIKINRFYGSLQALQNCTKLTYLNIDNTDINEGLEYLSDVFVQISCLFNVIPNAKCQEIAKEIPWKNNYKLQLKIIAQDKKLFKLIKMNFTPKLFEIELNKHNSIFSNNDFSNLFTRWKENDLNILLVENLKNEIKSLEERKQAGENIQSELNEKIKLLEFEIKRIESDKVNKLNEAYKELNELKEASLNKFSDSDKEDLSSLIAIHKELIQTKLLKQSFHKIKKDYDKLYYCLTERIGISFIDSIDLILSNFESFYQLELTIEERIKEKAEHLARYSFLTEQLFKLESFIVEIKESIKSKEKFKKIKSEQCPTVINYFIEKKKEITYYGDIIQSIVDNKSIELNDFNPSLTDKLDSLMIKDNDQYEFIEN
ncbi:MAG: hypothetical protein AM1032_000338 [Mycoplasmataceae bacterium]|nr:MAG: hypothetical protein AM1032_000338 [Mycoplasmataceae bacterium]